MRKFLYALVILIGLLQSIGYITGIVAVRGFGQALGSSPLPIVFTQVHGVETFACDFFIKYVDESEVACEVQITPALYSKLKGPYNRRNVFGAAISYGPVLKKELWQAVLNYGLCKKILVEEMGLPNTASNYCISIKTRTAGRNDMWTLKPDCSY